MADDEKRLQEQQEQALRRRVREANARSAATARAANEHRRADADRD
ncbi:hypothetical protein [Streptomyces sp. SID3343]|nr:hypothetical protein [Streptomyces sp. SID3343]MYW00388.1 hypothetical protein [Streptomyces sp. SID3343]MYW04591.1 hypothetical protein [Streptomyces sp. SID3343]